MAYPLSTQDSSPRFETRRSLAIWGRAMLTMKRSRLARTTPAQTMASTSRELVDARLGLRLGPLRQSGYRHETHSRPVEFYDATH